jgi:hypothetical protein
MEEAYSWVWLGGGAVGVGVVELLEPSMLYREWAREAVRDVPFGRHDSRAGSLVSPAPGIVP